MLKIIRQHPRHAIVGAVLFFMGLNLIFSDHYYLWPPIVAEALNGGVPGFWAMISGLGLLYLALQQEISARTNLVWVLSASGFLGFEAVLEFGHALVGMGPHTFALAIADLGYLTMVFDMAKHSDPTTKSKNRKDW